MGKGALGTAAVAGANPFASGSTPVSGPSSTSLNPFMTGARVWLVHLPFLAAVNKQIPLGQGVPSSGGSVFGAPGAEAKDGAAPTPVSSFGSLFGKGASTSNDKSEGIKRGLPASSSGNTSVSSFDSLKAQAQAAIDKEAHGKGCSSGSF